MKKITLKSNSIAETIDVKKEHKGIAIILDQDYKSNFNEQQIFEISRGIWCKRLKTIAGDSKYAFATFNDLVVDVYEIYCWVPAGSQQYFTRTLDPGRLINNNWEFIGKISSDELREYYVGKKINRKRSYGNAFVPVGYDHD